LFYARLETLERQLTEERSARVALENERAADREVRQAVDVERQRALAEARATAQQAAIEAGRAANEARAQMLAAQKRALEAERARDAARKATEDALREQLAAQKQQLEAERARAAAERARIASSVATTSEGRQSLQFVDEPLPDDVKRYISAARGGNCEAARTLGDIYDKGLNGVRRNYAESLKWYNAARVLGCEVPITRRGAP
jgi:membrane protein involved in colicin uptake